MAEGYKLDQAIFLPPGPTGPHLHLANCFPLNEDPIQHRPTMVHLHNLDQYEFWPWLRMLKCLQIVDQHDGRLLGVVARLHGSPVSKCPSHG